MDLQVPLADIQYLVARALAEDLTPLGDLTSSLLDPAQLATATFSPRAPGVVYGCRCVEETFRAVDERLTCLDVIAAVDAQVLALRHEVLALDATLTLDDDRALAAPLLA